MVFMLFCSIYHLLSKCLSCIRVEEPFILDITSGYVWTTDTQPFSVKHDHCIIRESIYKSYGFEISNVNVALTFSTNKNSKFYAKFCTISYIGLFRKYIALPDNISFCIIISLQKRNYMSVVQDQSAI